MKNYAPRHVPTHRSSLPVNRNFGTPRIVHIAQRHVLDQKPQQLLSLAVARRWRFPQSRYILRERQDLLALPAGQLARRLLLGFLIGWPSNWIPRVSAAGR